MSAQVFARRESGASFSGIAVGCRSTPTDMESPGAVSRAPVDPPRVKFLCSFGGSVLPRPLDGQLRYVGGDTRIIAVPRDVSYEDLLGRMREIFEGVSIIKYQQPDEDIDALVSVVNDDDVINMMEEFDKLVGVPGDGFTRLRIFLFAQQSENDLVAISPPLGDRDADRRYVDALNSLPPSPDTLEQCLSPPGIDVGIQGQVNLHHIKAPNPYHMQRYGEADYPLSPAYYSPGHHACALNPLEFTPSPSAARFPYAAGECGDRVQDELAKQAAVHQLYSYEHQSPSRQLENFVWLPPGAIVHEKAGFPSNLGHSRAVMDGNNNCEHCRMAFERNSDVLSDTYYLDHGWKHGQTKLEHLNTLNDVGHFPNSCSECHPNQDLKLNHGGYAREQNEQHHSIFSEVYACDRTSHMRSHQVGHRIDDTRLHSGPGRVSEHHVLDCNVMDIPLLHRNIYGAHSSPSDCTVHDVKSYPRNDTGMVNDVFLPPGPYTNIQGFQDSAMRYGNSAYGTESLYQVPHNLPPIPALQMKLQAPAYSGTSYESSCFMMPNGVSISGFEKHTQEGSPRSPYFQVEDEIPNGILEQNNNLLLKFQGYDNSMALHFLYQHATQLNPNAHNQDNLLPVASDSASCFPSKLHTEAPQIQLVTSVPECPTDKNLLVHSASGLHHLPVIGHGITVEIETLLDKNLNEGHMEIGSKPGGDFNEKEQVMEVNLGILNLNEGPSSKVFHADDSNASHSNGNIPEEILKFLPELIASVKKAILKGAEEVITEAQKDSEAGVLPASQENPNAAMEAEFHTNGDDEQNKHSKVEPTTAESEALTKGLQIINNDDLEEIRELGAGTFGSVYYGKWRGSDVAIKRIKASCFAGKPSERERLIADFWKEALIMSSLHHPNVVSFYGVVRDGSDGSLATITEFMINGSLKQFLQKKDRTIDRRKRLIIAMDVACGMEYLHSKNIVHFDLKCENLLVNMRDPHRPICKIGDLGLSKVKKHTLVSGGIRGTLPWMAPELLSGKSNKVSEKIDVYSFGIVMWELLTGEDPYADMRSASMIGGIINNTLRPKVPTWCDPEWKSLMESCWSSDPVLRPSFSDISQNLRKMAAAMNLK